MLNSIQYSHDGLRILSSKVKIPYQNTNGMTGGILTEWRVEY